MFWVWVNEKQMERRSRRRRTLRRQNRQQESFHGAKPPNPDISGRGLDPGNNSFPPDASEMVTRIRAEGRNIAPDPLTKHHLTGEGSDASFKAESPKAEGSNFVSGLFKQISDKTGLEWVRWWQWLKSCQRGFGKNYFKKWDKLYLSKLMITRSVLLTWRTLPQSGESSWSNAFSSQLSRLMPHRWKCFLFSSWLVFHVSFLGDAMDPEHGGHADGQLHHPWLPGRGRAAQEGAWTVSSGHWGES